VSESTLASERDARTVRIAAIGDLHVHTHVPDHLERELTALNGAVDVLVLAGDLTEGGRIPEVELVSDLLARVTVPMVAVLGNHDRRGLRRTVMRRMYESSGVRLLDGDTMRHELPGGRAIGFAGVSGTGGGFWPDEVPDLIGARISQAVAVKSRREAARLHQALDSLDHQEIDVTIVLMHFAPTVSTLGAEPPLKYWMLGNSLLGRVVDAHSVDLVLHGHAHLGNHAGRTPGGTPVRNVAAQVTGGVTIFEVERGGHVRPLTHHPPVRPRGRRAGTLNALRSRD
jgi:Icc-related predicted phosphoesterase